MGKEVFDAARIKGEWLFVPDATHSDIGEVGGEAYWQWIEKALARLTSDAQMKGAR
jgi:hypothetical protein